MRAADGATRASGAMAPEATSVSVTWVGRVAPPSGSLPIRPLPYTGRSRAGPRSVVLHRQVPTHLNVHRLASVANRLAGRVQSTQSSAGRPVLSRASGHMLAAAVGGAGY